MKTFELFDGGLREAEKSRGDREPKRRLPILFLLLSLIAAACGSEPIEDSQAADETAEDSSNTTTPDSVAMSGCIEPPQGLTHWWTFDDGDWNEELNPTPGREGVANSGNVQSSSGVVNEGVNFQGDDLKPSDYLTVGDGLDLGSGDFSMDAWVYTERGSGTSVGIVDSRTSGGPGVLLASYQGKLLLQLYKDSSSHQNYYSSVPMPFGWTLVGASVTRDGDVRLTMNGQSVGVTAAGYASVAFDSDVLRFGSNSLGNGATGGVVDEIEIFDRALTDEEFEAIFNAGPDGKCRNTPPECLDVSEALTTFAPGQNIELEAWWPFDEPGITSEVSEFDTKNPFEITTMKSKTNPAAGMVGNSFDARGVGTYAVAPRPTGAINTLDFGPDDDYSVDMWIKYDPRTRIRGNPVGTAIGTISALPAIDEQGTREIPNGLLDELFDVETRRNRALEEIGDGQTPAGSLPDANLRDELPGEILIEQGFGEDGGWALSMDAEGDLWHLITVFDASKNKMLLRINGHTDGYSLNDGNWHLIAATTDIVTDGLGDATGWFYVDGAKAPVGQIADYRPTALSTNDEITIGGWSYNSHVLDEWNGWFDEVEIFRGELPEPFVKALYDAGSGGKCKPSVPTTQLCVAEFTLEWDSYSSKSTPVRENLILIVDQVANTPVTHSTEATLSVSGGNGAATISPARGNPAWGAAVDSAQLVMTPMQQGEMHKETWKFTGITDLSTSFIVRPEQQSLSNSPHKWTLTGKVELETYQGAILQSTKTVGSELNETGEHTSSTAGGGSQSGPLNNKGSAAGPFELPCDEPVETPNFRGTCVIGQPGQLYVGSPIEFEIVAPDAPSGMLFTFDDGVAATANPSPSTAKKMSFTYTNQGSYTVTITWIQPDGSIGAAECGVEVVDQALPICEVSQTKLTLGQTIQIFLYDVNGTPVAADWDMGDTNTYLGISLVNHTYAQAGMYQVVATTTTGQKVPCTPIKVEAEVVSVNLAAGCKFEGVGRPESGDPDGNGTNEQFWILPGAAAGSVVLVQTAQNPSGTTTTWSFKELTGTNATATPVTGGTKTVTLPPGYWEVTVTTTHANAAAPASATCHLWVDG